MDIFDSVVAVFNFIYSLLTTIIDGIYGTIQVITAIVNLLFNIIRLLPDPLYSTLYFFISLYIVIFTYKITRQG